MDAPLHPDVEALRPLLGRWTGEGTGHYPTIDAFRYREDVTFGHVGKPFLAYRQATVRLDTDQPSHAEVGYLRGVGGGRIELVLAHPTGVAEVAEGEVVEGDGGLTLRLMSVAVARTATAKEVTTLARTITVAGETLHYDLAMSAVGQPLQPHLSATLHRAGDPGP